MPRELHSVEDIRYARTLDERPGWIHREARARGAKALGIRYERRAKQRLEGYILARPDLVLVTGQWVEYQLTGGRKKWLEIDALVRNPERKLGICYEIKYRHTAEAWFQIWRFYIPVLTWLWPDYDWQGCEICNWIDPLTTWPEPYALTKSPLAIPQRGRTAVHVYNPQRDD